MAYHEMKNSKFCERNTKYILI